MRSSLVSLAAIVLLAVGCSDSTSQPLADAGPLPAPTLTSIGPSSGPKSGGTTVSVLGSNFVDGVKLYIGGVEATQITFISDVRITGSTQVSATTGKVDVKVVNPDGQSATLAQGFEFIPPPNERTTVDSCQLLSPQSVTIGEGSLTVDIIGTVSAVGVTDSAGQGGNIVGELGYAPSSAGVDTSAWTWVLADYNPDHSGTAFDAYSALIAAPVKGDYVYAFRFQYNGGDWMYCDLDGSDSGGFTANQLGRLIVVGPQVDWCNLQWPPAAISTGGQPATLPDGTSISKLPDGGPDTSVPAGTIYSHVYKRGVTDSADQGPGITSQMGVGPADAGPGTSGWVWVDATYNTTCTTCNDGHDDEYQAQLVGPQFSGNYSYTFRYKVDGGDWAYCSQTGLISGDKTTGMGQLTNTGATPLSPTVDWCELETATATGQAGQLSEPLSSQVKKTGVTDSAGNGSLLKAEVGIGPSNTTPVSNGWLWVTTNFSASGLGIYGNNYRYSGSAPLGDPGTYALAYRYQYGSGPYVYCDTAGIWDAGTANLGVLTVTPASDVQCATESLSAGVITSGSPLTAVAHVYAPAITDSPGQGAGLITQVGVGTPGIAPSQPGWGWKTATYLDDSDGGATDRYTATVTPAYTGDRGVIFRVSEDDGGSWSYCNPSQVPDGGYLKVDPYDATAAIGYCNLDYPSPVNGGTLTQPATVVYGQVYAAGITDSSADAGLITAQLGVGQASEDPGVSQTWTWYDAGFNVPVTNNYSYMLAFPSEPAGSYNYAFRYTLDGGTWCYGDQQSPQQGVPGGSSNGVTGDDLGVANLP